MIALGWAIATFLISALAVAVFTRFARRLPFVDKPNERSAHAKDTLSSGGLAVMFALGVSVTIAVSSGKVLLPLAVISLLLPTFIISAIGGLDDWRSLPATPRLLGFFILAAWVMYLFGQSLTLSSGVLIVFIVIGLVWLVNLFNFMDGVDGLAAIQCIFAASALAVLAWLRGGPVGFPVFAGMIGGAYAGFLVFNWPPARLFMGDAGSLPAGLLLGALGLWLWQDGSVSVYAWFILMSPFLLDTSFTLVRRLVRGENIVKAHSEHIYQRLTRHFGGPARINAGLIALHLLWLFPLAWLCVIGQQARWTFLALALFPQLFLIAKYYRLQ